MQVLKENQLLIAEPFLKDDNFMRSVVYLCKHSEEGSFGFVLNKPYELTLDELFEGLDGYSFPVFVGGPVESDTVHFLHQYPDLIKGSYALTDQIYWGGDFEDVKELIRNNKIETTKIKFFIGYSGWDKSQLENELNEKTWLIAASNKKMIFDLPANEIWRESIKLLGSDYEIMANFPIDPQLN